MRKKWMSVLFSFALALSCAACGNSSGAASASVSDQAAMQPLEESDLERGTTMSLEREGSIAINRNVELGNVPMGEEGTWTVFVYICGADLESAERGGFATLDMQEMSAASTGENVRFVIQTGGANKWHNEVVASELGRYEICNGRMTKIDAQPDASMGSEDTLVDFLKWGVEKYPAANMGVIFWDHGGGSIAGVCVDERWERDKLSLTEIDAALAGVSKEMTDRFEFIGFDACLMATVESANILAPYANYMYASEETEVGNGWDYTAIGNYLGTNPGANGEELGQVVCDSYFDMLEQINSTDRGTLSVTDLSKLDNLIRCYHLYAKELDAASKDLDVLTLVVRSLRDAQWFGNNSKATGYTNMLDLAGIVSAGEEYSINTSQVLEAIDEAVVYVRNGSLHKDSCGLATYYPLAFNGQAEIEIFGDIAISPYYLSFVSRSLYGLTHNGDMSGYVEEEVVDVWSDTWSGESTAEETDNYWDNYADIEDPGQSQIIQFEQEPMITEGWDLGYTYRDGPNYGFKLTEESENNLAAIYVNEWMLSPDGEYLLYLGNHYISHVGQQYGYGYSYELLKTPIGIFSDDAFINNVLALLADNYLQPLPTYIVNVNGAHNKEMLVPMLVNGEVTYLHRGALVIDGKWQGLAADGMAGRELGELKASDVLTPIYNAISLETGELTVYYGASRTLAEDGPLVFEGTKQNAILYRSFELIDVFGNSYETASVRTEFADGELISCEIMESETDIDNSQDIDMSDMSDIENIKSVCGLVAPVETSVEECHWDSYGEHPYDVVYDFGEEYQAYVDACDWSLVFDAEYYMNEFPMLALQYHYDEKELLFHFQTVGIHEGRQGSEDFNVYAYAMNSDQSIEDAFGSNYEGYYLYYMLNYDTEKDINTVTTNATGNMRTMYKFRPTALQIEEMEAVCETRNNANVEDVTLSSEPCAFANYSAYLNAHDGYEAHDWAKENLDLFNAYCTQMGGSAAAENITTFHTGIGRVGKITEPGYRDSESSYNNMVRETFRYIGVSNVCNGDDSSSQFDYFIDNVN